MLKSGEIKSDQMGFPVSISLYMSGKRCGLIFAGAQHMNPSKYLEAFNSVSEADAMIGEWIDEYRMNLNQAQSPSAQNE